MSPAQHGRMKSAWSGCWLMCAAVLAGALGCKAHVSLFVPPPSAPLAEREAAYLKLRPLQIHQTITTSTNGGYSFDESLTLANGTKVYYPEDILSVVPRDSKSAELVEQSRSSSATATTCSLSGFAALAAFAAILFGTHDSSSLGGLRTPGLVATGLGAVGLSITGYFFAQSASNRAVEAYSHYDEGLQDALAICAGPHCGDPVVRDASKASAPSAKAGAEHSKR